MVTLCLTKTENITKKSLFFPQKNFHTTALSKGTILEKNDEFLQKSAGIGKSKISLQSWAKYLEQTREIQ